MRTERGFVRAVSVVGIGILAAGVAAVFVLGAPPEAGGGSAGASSEATRSDASKLVAGTRTAAFVSPLDRAIEETIGAEQPAAPRADPASVTGTWRVLAGTVTTGAGAGSAVASTSDAGDRSIEITAAADGLVVRFAPGTATIAVREEGGRFKGSRKDADGTTVALDISPVGKDLAVAVRVDGDPVTTWGFRATRLP